MGIITAKDAAGAAATLPAGTLLAVEDTGTGIINNTIDGISALISGSPVSVSEHRWATAALSVANTIASSKYTRSRVMAGKQPIGKLFF